MKPTAAALLLLLPLAAQSFLTRDQIASTRRRLDQIASSPEASFQSMKVPESIYELSSPVDYVSQSSGAASPSPSLTISVLNHDANYIKIADDLKRYEDAYAGCINHLSDNDFSDETVEACVGPDYNYVFDDMDYEKSKILARADSALRDFMIQNCYTVAGVDLVMSNACDLVETDAVNLLWNELNFAKLIDFHRNKYLFEHAFMGEAPFNKLVGEFGQIWGETNSLLGELYDHRKLTVAHLEDLISRRTSELLEKYRDATQQFVEFEYVMEGDQWKKKQRQLGGTAARLPTGDRPPMARFLQLNERNLKTAATFKSQSKDQDKKEPANAKIVVDEANKKGAV